MGNETFYWDGPKRQTQLMQLRKERLCSPSEAKVGGNHKKVILWKFYIADIEGREEQMLN